MVKVTFMVHTPPASNRHEFHPSAKPQTLYGAPTALEKPSVPCYLLPLVNLIRVNLSPL